MKVINLGIKKAIFNDLFQVNAKNVDKPKAPLINLSKTKELPSLSTDNQKDYINPAYSKIKSHTAFMEAIKGIIKIKPIENGF